MALIGKIRNNFWLVLIILGLALASFVLMDIMGSSSRAGAAKATIGEVAGQEIDYREFSKVESELFSGGSNTYANKQQLWNYLVEKKIVDAQAEELGIGVSRDELMDLQFGNNLSPIITNNFRNQQTGQVDRQQLLQFKQAIENGDPLNPKFRSFWAEQEKQIVKTKLQDKISNMVSKGMYTPSFAVELNNQFNTEKATFEYVKIPFDNVEDSDVTVTDADYSNYINENKGIYTTDEETRTLAYAAFDVVASSSDSSTLRTNMIGLAEEFRNTANDSMFAFNNGGAYSIIYNKADDIPEEFRDGITSIEVGQTFGPYVQNGNFVVTKLVDKQIIPDSVEARHILRSVENGDPTQLADAKRVIDSLENVLLSGAERFDSLAVKFSDDPGSGFKGGELGTFAQGRMVPNFNNAVFVNSKKGGLYKVTTQFGVHLIEVTNKVFENRDPKYKLSLIATPIVPSEDTQNAALDKVSALLSANRSIDAMETALANVPGVSIKTSQPLKQNDFTVGNLGTGEDARNMVKYAFGQNVELGKLSPEIYKYTDKVNYFDKTYVVAGLKEVSPAGLPSVTALKSSIEPLVKSQAKGKKLATMITSKDLSALASQYEGSVETASNVSATAQFVPQLGNEPKVVAAAFDLQPGQVSSPIVGNTGVYVIKSVSKVPGQTTASVPVLRKTANSTARSQVGFRLWDAVKNMFNIEDNRSDFF